MAQAVWAKNAAQHGCCLACRAHWHLRLMLCLAGKSLLIRCWTGLLQQWSSLHYSISRRPRLRQPVGSVTGSAHGVQGMQAPHDMLQLAQMCHDACAIGCWKQRMTCVTTPGAAPCCAQQRHQPRAPRGAPPRHMSASCASRRARAQACCARAPRPCASTSQTGAPAARHAYASCTRQQVLFCRRSHGSGEAHGHLRR